MTRNDIETSVRNALKVKATPEEWEDLYWKVQDFMKDPSHDLNWSIIEIVTMMHISMTREKP